MKGWVQEFPTYYWLSWLIMGMAVYIMALSFVETRQEEYDKRAEREKAKAKNIEPEMELVTT